MKSEEKNFWKIFDMNKIIIFLWGTVLMAAGCASDQLETTDLFIKGKHLTVELADTPEKRQTGLMNRDKLDSDAGMLFVFEEERQVSFWMKNTSIPLSIAYIGKDGRIREIRELEPFSQKSVKSSRSVKYALEVNCGYFVNQGISEGDKIEFPSDWPY